MSEAENVANWTILVVDDHYDNVMVAQTTLEFNGATVAVANNGEEALTMLKTLQPTAILLDLSMPLLTGWETLKRIRDEELVPPSLAIIAVTAHAMAGDRQRALQAGFDGYIPKPYNVLELIPTIKRILTSKKASEE